MPIKSSNDLQNSLKPCTVTDHLFGRLASISHKRGWEGIPSGTAEVGRVQDLHFVSFSCGGRVVQNLA
eukprot:2356238-Amphidinium_carterae.1